MRNLLFIFFCLLMANGVLAQQDTTWVQTLTFDDITKRRGWYQFPDGTESYRKVLMYYTLKCDAATTQDGYACGEWDYLTYSHVFDHTGLLDSNYVHHPHYLYGGANLDTFAYTTTVQYDTLYTTAIAQVIDSVLSETSFLIGSNMGSTDAPLGGHVQARAQYIWTASELTNAGMAAGNIHRLAIPLTDYQTDLSRLSISLKNTGANQPHYFETNLTVVYNQITNFTQGAGTYYFNFTTPFEWDGTSNLLVEFTHWADGNTAHNQTSFANTADSMGLVAAGADYAANFENAKYMEIPLGETDFGNDVTVSFWSYGNPATQPANSYAFEAVNTQGQRVLNVHLPWSNGRIYWDAGEGSGYDRIDKAATAAEYQGNWVHWAFTKNATTGSMKIYKNGVLWHSGTGMDSPIGEISRFVVGKAFNSTTSHNGMMDEFRVWNTALDANTISDWMHQSVTSAHPNYADLVAYYNFNQANYALTDQSENNNTPTLFGPPQLVAKATADYTMNASRTVQRPLVTFLQGNYQTHTDTLNNAVAVPATPTTLTEFAVQGNAISAINTQFVYNGYTSIYNTDGSVDSIPIVTNTTSYNDTLWYYQPPFEVIDRYEIGRYITPYGINLSLGPQGFTWVYDVTDYVHLLQDSVDISNGNQQELIDVRFAFIKGTPMAPVKELTRPWGASGSKLYGDLDSDAALEPTEVAIHPQAEHFKMKTRLTGHGHNSNTGNYPHCCEWKDNTHYLYVNGNQHAQWHIWQTDQCALNPVFPQGGTWPGAREGWCPGDVVKDNEFMITNQVTGNTVNIDYGITPVPANNAGMAGGNYIVAMHLLQYGAASHTLDAEVYDILTPTSWEYRSRTNPFCDDAKIVIRNAGSTTLTQLNINYQVAGGTPLTYQWTGNLAFMEMEEVTLPINDASFWQGDNTWQFIATVSAPNGQPDEYAGNDSYVSHFEMPDVYESDLIVQYKTNNYPHENYWEIRDINGSVVAERTTADANTIYRDTLDLPHGCYTFYMYDSANDGLSYWAWPNQGSGTIKLKKNGGAYFKSFPSEFGKQITHGFSVGVIANVAEHQTKPFLEVYPNPNQGSFTLELSETVGKHQVTVLNAMGQVVDQRTVDVHRFHTEHFNLNKAESGVYYVRIVGPSTNQVLRVVLQD